MRAYLIDEISQPDMEGIIAFLKQHSIKSSLDKIFWVKMPENLLTGGQFDHTDCKPHIFAVEVGRNWIKLEFFIRSLKGLKCECQAYGNHQQIDFIINYSHQILNSLDIKT